MAHLESYGKNDLRQVLREHDRTATAYRNKVDRTRSHLNWGYGGASASADDVCLRFSSRVADIMQGQPIQKQTNVCCEWVVTYPFELCTERTEDTGKTDKDGKPILKRYNVPNDMQQCKRFFDEVYNFTVKRYGADNVICGYVHMDETTPHIAIDFVPEATSRKTGRRTVSSASKVTRKELMTYHKDLNKSLELSFGMPKMILNGRTKGKYTVDELQQRDKDRKAFESELEAMKQRTIQQTQAELLTTQQQIASNKRTIDEQQQEIDENTKRINGQVDTWNKNKPIMDAQQQQLEKLQADIDDQFATWEHNKPIMDAQQQELESNKRTLAEQQKTIKSNTAFLSGLQAEIDDLTPKCNEVKQEAEKAVKTLENASADVSALELRKTALQNDIERLTVERLQAEQEAEQKAQRIISDANSTANGIIQEAKQEAVKIRKNSMALGNRTRAVQENGERITGETSKGRYGSSSWQDYQ